VDCQVARRDRCSHVWLVWAVVGLASSRPCLRPDSEFRRRSRVRRHAPGCPRSIGRPGPAGARCVRGSARQGKCPAYRWAYSAPLVICLTLRARRPVRPGGRRSTPRAAGPVLAAACPAAAGRAGGVHRSRSLRATTSPATSASRRSLLKADARRRMSGSVTLTPSWAKTMPAALCAIKRPRAARARSMGNPASRSDDRRHAERRTG
jgi:hypothetical protein